MGQVCVISLIISFNKEQIKCLELISSVLFAFGICLQSILKMRAKELSLSVKQAIIRLKYQNKPIREIAKTNQLFGTFLKRKNAPVSSATPKDPEDHRKQLWWMTEELFPWWRKNPSQTVGQIKNTLQEVGVCVSKVNNQEKTSPEWIQRVSPQDVYHWWASKTGRPD